MGGLQHERLGPTTEVVRQLKSGQLELRVNQYGRDDLNGGNQYGNAGVNFRNPALITAIQASVKVAIAQATSCPANSTLVRGGLHANPFNDGSSSGAGDRTGDIQAVFTKTHSTNLGNIIRADLRRCSDPSCSSSTPTGEHTFSGTWRVNESNIMTLMWDAANNQVHYSIKRGRNTETIPLSYTVSDANPPAVQFKNLIAEASVANCAGERQHGFVSVLFGNAMVNP